MVCNRSPTRRSLPQNNRQVGRRERWSLNSDTTSARSASSSASAVTVEQPYTTPNMDRASARAVPRDIKNIPNDILMNDKQDISKPPSRRYTCQICGAKGRRGNSDGARNLPPICPPCIRYRRYIDSMRSNVHYKRYMESVYPTPETLCGRLKKKLVQLLSLWNHTLQSHN